jgi:cytochrome c553
VRSHVFRIATDVATFDEVVTADGMLLATDAQGRAGLTVDIVCARCHGTGATEANSAFPIDNELARQIAGNLHRLGDE